MLTGSQEKHKRSRFWHVARRRRWWIYSSAFLCWCVVFGLLANRKTFLFLWNETPRSQSQQVHGAHTQPDLPIKSSAPARFVFSLAGLCLGISVGIGLTWLREMSDARVRSETDAVSLVPVRILVSVPHLSVAGEETQSALRVRTERVILGVFLVLILAGNIYIFVGY